MRDGIVSGDNHGVQRFHNQVTFMQGVNGVMNGGTTYYVDSSRSASGNGKEWDQAFITISEAVAASLAAGGTYDTILIKGTDNAETSGTITNDYSETVIIAAAQVGLRIIGIGNSSKGIAWTCGTQDDAILTINAKDCYVSGFHLRPNGAATGCGIYFMCSHDMTDNAVGSTVENCLIRSTTETALAGIRINAANDITIKNCILSSVVTGIASIEDGGSVQYRTIIEDCFVDNKCTNGFVVGGISMLIKNNALSSGLTSVIDTTGHTSSTDNVVTGNTLQVTAYETQCTGEAADVWLGNYCNDVASSMVGASGVTIGIPTG